MLWVFFTVLAILIVGAIARGGFAGLLRLLVGFAIFGGVVFLLAMAEMDLVAAGLFVIVLVGAAGIVLGLLRKILG